MPDSSDAFSRRAEEVEESVSWCFFFTVLYAFPEDLLSVLCFELFRTGVVNALLYDTSTPR
jgi:hypothetical protein